MIRLAVHVILSHATMLALCTLLASDVRAQCPTSGCNMKTHHWIIPGMGSTDSEDIRLGMFFDTVSGNWYPAGCERNDAGVFVALGTDQNFPYASKALTADTSFCAGSGSDKVTIVGNSTNSTTCAGPLGGTVTIWGFSGGGWDFTISGESGNDHLAVCGCGGLGTVSYNSDVNLCGGPSNDYLVGGNGSDVLVGGSNNDFLDGRSGVDTLRGGVGDDVLHHFFTSSTDADALRGEDDNDCVAITFSDTAIFGASSTCGSDTTNDTYQHSNAPGWPPVSCEVQSPDCCAEAGKDCTPL